jgi:predicted DsbA family dithiol-disulfide isomerase
VNRLDFYFDYACPWCYLGSFTVRELEREGVQVDYRVWKMPPGANPPPKPEGYYEAARARLKQLREEKQIPLSSPIQSDTVPALIATKVATEMGKASEFVAAVFHAHWGAKQNIADRETLLFLAEQVGLDRDAFAAALDSGRGQAAFEQDLQMAATENIDTIPAYLNGNKRLLIHHFNDMPSLDDIRELSR